MLFARRRPPTLPTRLRNILWPKMGWRRAARYYLGKLRRLPVSPGEVAAGFGWGVAVSITPLLGAHTILSVLCARATRASMVAAFIGTFALNPWTAPPIWLATYYLGKVMAGDSVGGGLPGFVGMFRGLTEAFLTLDTRLFFEQVWPVFAPMLLGSLPIGGIAGFAGYAVLRSALMRLQSKRGSGA